MFGCAMRHLDVRPLTDAVGAEIRGVDVSGNPDDTTIDAIRTAFSRHAVVLFRDQSLDAPGLAAFSRRFGRLAHSGNQCYSAPDAADVMLVGNLVVDGEWKSMFTNGMEDWHVDQKQVLDIVATVTMYHAMAIFTRTFAIPIDEEKPSFSIEDVE